MPRKGSPYGKQYEQMREAMWGLPCQMQLVCSGDPSTSLDHDPPLSRHDHVEGSGCCLLRPACQPCQRHQAKTLAGETRHFRARGLEPPRVGASVPEPSRRWV